MRQLRHPLVACGALGALFGAVALRGASRPTLDIDAWWIAATGRVILADGQIPRVNLFSFTEPAHAWVMHEWLYAILFAKGMAWMGEAFLTVFGFASAMLTAGLVLGMTLGRARHVPSAALFGGIALGGTIHSIDSPRPLYASIAFALIVADVAFRERASLKLLALAVATELVWVNAHGSFPLGVVLLASGAVLVREDRRARILATLAAVGATFVNPHGAGIYGLVDRYLRGGDEASDLIRSHLGGFMHIWQGPSPFVDGWGVAAVVSVAVVAATSLASPRHRARGAVSLGLLALGAVQVRHLALGTLVGWVLVAPALSDRFASPETSSVDRRGALWRLGLALLPALVLGSFSLGSALRNRPAEAWIAPDLGGASFARLAAALPADAHVYTSFRSTGLLLWLEATRGVRVLYDSRNDCYSATVISDALALEEATISLRQMHEVIGRYRPDYVLAASQSPVARALLSFPGWVQRAQDGDWVLLERWGRAGERRPRRGLTRRGKRDRALRRRSHGASRSWAGGKSSGARSCPDSGTHSLMAMLTASCASVPRLVPDGVPDDQSAVELQGAGVNLHVVANS